MRFVEKAVIRPHSCAAIPHLGSAHRDGYFDTGAEMPGFDNHVYVSVVAVKEMARMLGWHGPEQQKAYDDALEAKDAEITELREQLSAAQEKLNAVHVLRAAGFTASRKPGRPPAKQKVSG